jgi:hypothetical protein
MLTEIGVSINFFNHLRDKITITITVTNDYFRLTPKSIHPFKNVFVTTV